jgi:choline dehydrogenase-like flavoprotein
MDLTASVVIVGSGMGGATTALALTQAGVDVIVLERGDFLPSEIQNWSPEEVFLNQRYKPHEEWLDGKGRAFAPGVHYVVGGNTKLYGASLPRFRESDFNAVDHLEGCSPAWPFSYKDLEPYYCAAENIYRVHGTTGEDPTEPWRSESFPFPAVPHEPYISEMAERLRGQNVHPSSNAMGIDLALGGTCIRCPTCDGFPCRIGAKSDAETCAIAPALATGHLRLITSAKVVRIVAKANRVTHLDVETPDGLVRVGGGKFVISAGAVNSAALLLASRTGDFPSGLSNASDQVGRNFMMHNNAHIAAVDVNRLNDVVFQKTISINDWYHDGGDGYPLGALQLIGKVQGTMMIR